MRAPHVPSTARGTFAGLRQHIDHIAALGVTAVELLPVHQFDPDEGNYWGYMPLAWSALHHGYVAGDDPDDDEFREMVQRVPRRRHRGDPRRRLQPHHRGGPRGPDASTCARSTTPPYYVLYDDGSYVDDAGCGNIARAAHPAVSKMILDSLIRFADLGVDGFRFDLGSILGRDIDGKVAARQRADRRDHGAWPPRATSGSIAEAWDLASYQVGDAFPGRTWASVERSVPRRLSCVPACRGRRRQRGSRCACRAVPTCTAPTSARSVNFITAHDGYTLYDLVSYEQKHNEANGQDGQDGNNDNKSWNCGWEGDDIPDDIADDVRDLADAADEERDGAARHVRRDADDRRRRRVRADPERQQQPVQPGQRDHLARLGPRAAFAELTEWVRRVDLACARSAAADRSRCTASMSRPTSVRVRTRSPGVAAICM